MTPAGEAPGSVPHAKKHEAPPQGNMVKPKQSLGSLVLLTAN